MNYQRKEAPLKIWVWIVIIGIYIIISIIPLVGNLLITLLSIFLGFFCKYKSLKNFARAYLCFIVVILIIGYIIL